jgi:hypothetical protein
LVVSLATYTAAAGIIFIPPTNPGVAPVIPAEATESIITALNCQFLADKKEFMI